MLTRAAAAALALATLSSAGLAQETVSTQEAPSPLEQRAADVVSVLKGELPADIVFAPAFLAEVPAEALKAIQTQMESQFGPLQGVESVTPPEGAEPATIMFRFERGIAGGPASIQPTAPFKVTGLRISNFQAIDDSAEAILSEVRALPGKTSILLTPLDNGAPLISYQPDTQLAVGSSFKLYVLSALAQSIAAGEHRWNEIVPLTQKSLPSGILQDWPRGTPLTVQTLATLMISISDNTATDQLMTLLGPDRLEAELHAAGNTDPSATIPFLTTREMFALKTLDPHRIRDFVSGSDMGQRQFLASMGNAPVAAGDVQRVFAEGPRYLDVEWFASAEDIAALFVRLRQSRDPVVLDILAVNKAASPSQSGRWSYIGYKGGSEPGVLSLNWLLRNRGGRWYVLSMSWNNPEAPVDSRAFEMLAARAMAIAPEE